MWALPTLLNTPPSKRKPENTTLKITLFIRLHAFTKPICTPAHVRRQRLMIADLAAALLARSSSLAALLLAHNLAALGLLLGLELLELRLDGLLGLIGRWMDGRMWIDGWCHAIPSSISFYLSIHLSMHPSIHPSFLSIYLSIYLSINPSIHLYLSAFSTVIASRGSALEPCAAILSFSNCTACRLGAGIASGLGLG